MRSFLSGVVALVGLVVGVSGAYVAHGIFFPILSPVGELVPPAELALKSISVGGTVRTFDGERLTLEVDDPYAPGKSILLVALVSTTTIIRTFSPHLQKENGTTLFWKEDLAKKEGLLQEATLRASLFRTAGELRAVALTIYLPS